MTFKEGWDYVAWVEYRTELCLLFSKTQNITSLVERKLKKIHIQFYILKKSMIFAFMIQIKKTIVLQIPD